MKTDVQFFVHSWISFPQVTLSVVEQLSFNRDSCKFLAEISEISNGAN